MSMHLVGPWLSTTGKRRGKQKWASAEQKRQAEELEAQWQQLKSKYEPSNKVSSKSTKPVSSRRQYTPPTTVRRDTGPRLPSVDTGHTGAVNVKAPIQYTGTKVKGIATMHKSNAVPVFTDEEAVDIARMRRG